MSAQNPIRLLCLADVHLGRGSPSLPEGIDLTHYTSRTAWRQLIHYATTHPIDAVLIAGDVVDQDDLFFETYCAFESGIRKILQCGIPVIAVAGNHDSKVFKKMTQTIASSHFYLLGKEGDWETLSLTIRDKLFRFAGWSFPKPHVSDNPLKTFPQNLLRDPDSTFIGILHCDCPGNVDSVYAPVKVEDFLSLPPNIWVLGHSHKPVVFNHDPLIFYCGSLQGLDSSECGTHGAHLLSLYPNGEVKKDLLSFANIRWEKMELPVSDSLEEAVILKLQALHQNLMSEPFSPEIIGCQLTLSGRTKEFRSLPEIIKKLVGHTILSRIHPTGREIHYFINHVINQTKPDLNLEELAAGDDPIALLANEIRGIQNGTISLEKAKNIIEKMHIRFPQFTDLSLSEEKIKELLLRSAFGVLDLLLSQKESQHEA